MAYFYLLISKINCPETVIRALEATKPYAFPAENGKEVLVVLPKGRNFRIEAQLQDSCVRFTSFATLPLSFKAANSYSITFNRFKGGDQNAGPAMSRRMWYS